MEKKTVLIVCLGNPGDKYAHTRHNAGFEVADLLEQKHALKLRKRMMQPWADGSWTEGDRRILLVRPLTFMNNSGEAVKKLMARTGAKPEDILVVYDDIDLRPGDVRFRKSGGPGTHNGMRSVIGETGTDAFPRIRIGTGDRPKGGDLIAWVLGRPGPEDRPKMEAAYETAAACAEEWARGGADAAMRLCAARKE